MHVNAAAAAAARGLSRGNKRKRDEDRRNREKIFHRKKESLDGDGESQGGDEKREERQMRRIDMDRGRLMEGVRKTNSRCIGNLKDQRPLLARSYSEGCGGGWVLFIVLAIPLSSHLSRFSPRELPFVVSPLLSSFQFFTRYSLLVPIFLAFNFYRFQFLSLPISIAFYLLFLSLPISLAAHLPC